MNKVMGPQRYVRTSYLTGIFQKNPIKVNFSLGNPIAALTSIKKIRNALS